MAQHFLNILQPGAVFQQMQRKGMPQHMWRNLLGNTGLLGISLDNLPKALPGQTASVQISKKGLSAGIVYQQGAHTANII